MRRPEKGYSMIELLLIVSFIGILASIAIGRFKEYKVKAYNTAAKTDLRNGLSSQEAYYTVNGGYTACSDILNCEALLSGFKGSKESDGSASADPYSFTTTGELLLGVSKHRLSPRTYSFDSAVGGSIVWTE